MRVNLELRYVMNCSLFFSIVDNAEMTLPSSNRPRLMLMPSFNTAPVAPVFLARSDPAKSTKKNLAVMVPSYCYLPFPIKMLCLIVMVKMACERELASFMSVLAVVLFFPPLSRSLNIWSASGTISSLTPVSVTEPSFSSRMAMLFWCLDNGRYTWGLWDVRLRADQWSVHCKFR